jgi:hypothetical protein
MNKQAFATSFMKSGIGKTLNKIPTVQSVAKRVGNKLLNPIRRDLDFKENNAKPTPEMLEHFRKIREGK